MRWVLAGGGCSRACADDAKATGAVMNARPATMARAFHYLSVFDVDFRLFSRPQWRLITMSHHHLPLQQEGAATLSIMSFRDWWKDSAARGDDADNDDDDDDSDGMQPRNNFLLDLQSHPVDSKAWRVANTRNSPLTIVNIPFSELNERSFELPPRDVPFAVLLDCRSLDVVKQVLHYLVGKPGLQHKPWLVTALIDASEPENWEQAKEELNSVWVESSIVVGKLKEEAPPFLPLPRLWRPDPMIEAILLPLLKQQLVKASERALPGYLEVWDLGSGAGRDVCFLAEELLCFYCNKRLWHHDDDMALNHSLPFCVIALDQRYRDSQRHTMEQWMQRRKIEKVTRLERINLQETASILSSIHAAQQEGHSLKCLYAVRYWNRSLVEKIAGDRTLLSEGTLFAMSHFGKAYRGAAWNHDHPKEKNVLERNELSEIFADDDWEILHDKVVQDSDHGRTLIQFVAQKKAK